MDYRHCITDDGKNYAAIEKIINALAFQDYRRENPIMANGRKKYKNHRPYILSYETQEAMGIKKKYLSGEITEEQYKAYCLRINLANRSV